MGSAGGKHPISTRERTGRLYGTVESRLSRRPSPTGLELGLMLEELQQCAAGLHAAAAADPEHGGASMLALFSTFALMVCRLRADGGGRSPKSFTKDTTVARGPKQVQMFGMLKVSCIKKGQHLKLTFSSVSSRKRRSWWSCLGIGEVIAGLGGGSFFISAGSLFTPSSLMADESLGLLSCNSRCRILCRSVSVLWDAGHWGVEGGG